MEQMLSPATAYLAHATKTSGVHVDRNAYTNQLHKKPPAKDLLILDTINGFCLVAAGGG